MRWRGGSIIPCAVLETNKSWTPLHVGHSCTEDRIKIRYNTLSRSFTLCMGITQVPVASCMRFCTKCKKWTLEKDAPDCPIPCFEYETTWRIPKKFDSGRSAVKSRRINNFCLYRSKIIHTLHGIQMLTITLHTSSYKNYTRHTTVNSISVCRTFYCIILHYMFRSSLVIFWSSGS
jgi:hypothetical protein